VSESQSSALAKAANSALAAKEWALAIPPLERLLALHSGNAQVARMLSTAHNNLGAAALRAGRTLDATRSCHAALAAWPDNPEALFNLARIALEARRHAQALPYLRRLRALKPDDPQVALELFETELAVATPEEVPALVPQLRESAKLARIDALRLGAALADAGEADEALAAIEALHGMEQFSAGISLAFRLGENVQPEAARRAYAHLAAQGGRGTRAPSLIACLGERLLLPPVYAGEDELAATRERFASGLEALHEEFDDARLARCEASLEQLRWTNFLLPYQGGDDRALQARYGELVARAARHFAPALCEAPARRPGGRRVGLLSSAFRYSTVGSYFGSWVGALTRAGFETVVFQLGPTFDDTTEAIGRDASRLVKLADAPIATLARQVRDARCDLLLFPDSAVDARIVPLTALRLAPVQVSGWGHPVTTGMATIDAYLSCAEMEPPDAQSHYVEPLLLLPGIGTRYARPAAPQRRERAALGLPGGRLYAVPQSLFKVHPQTDDVLARIAAADADARIVLFASERPGAARTVRARIARALADAGADPARQLVFLPLVHRSRFLEICAACDVMVDTPHWSGGNTAIDALVSGLPVAARPGRFMRGRQSQAMLRMLGLESELVAHDAEGQVRIALACARDAALREVLRARIDAGTDALFDGEQALAALATHVEALLAA
jgi:CRISPR-associated protein Csy1